MPIATVVFLSEVFWVANSQIKNAVSNVIYTRFNDAVTTMKI